MITTTEKETAAKNAKAAHDSLCSVASCIECVQTSKLHNCVSMHVLKNTVEFASLQTLHTCARNASNIGAKVKTYIATMGSNLVFSVKLVGPLMAAAEHCC